MSSGGFYTEIDALASEVNTLQLVDNNNKPDEAMPQATGPEITIVVVPVAGPNGGSLIAGLSSGASAPGGATISRTQVLHRRFDHLRSDHFVDFFRLVRERVPENSTLSVHIEENVAGYWGVEVTKTSIVEASMEVGFPEPRVQSFHTNHRNFNTGGHRVQTLVAQNALDVNDHLYTAPIPLDVRHGDEFDYLYRVRVALTNRDDRYLLDDLVLFCYVAA